MGDHLLETGFHKQALDLRDKSALRAVTAQSRVADGKRFRDILVSMDASHLFDQVFFQGEIRTARGIGLNFFAEPFKLSAADVLQVLAVGMRRRRLVEVNGNLKALPDLFSDLPGHPIVARTAPKPAPAPEPVGEGPRSEPSPGDAMLPRVSFRTGVTGTVAQRLP